MKHAKHTQGPWTVERNTVSTSVGHLCTISDETYLANDADFANARLISAAPEMLQLLQALQNHLDRPGKTIGDSKCIAAIQDLLFKATGGQNE